ncbi:MAG: hypothetical protein IKC75_04490 [Clostridia bacterium]|nr:hypothetical protein [Clostridia bacterium]
MKKFYEAPTSELIVISTADIITVSLNKLDVETDNFGTEIGDITIG